MQGRSDNNNQKSQRSVGSSGSYGTSAGYYKSKQRLYPSQSVMGRREEKKPDPKTPRERIGESTKSMIRKFSFNNLMSLGMSAESAAQRLGIKWPRGRRMDPMDVMDLKTKGELKKKKRI